MNELEIMALQPVVPIWEGGPVLPALLLFKDKPNIQIFILNLLSLEYGSKIITALCWPSR